MFDEDKRLQIIKKSGLNYDIVNQSQEHDANNNIDNSNSEFNKFYGNQAEVIKK